MRKRYINTKLIYGYINKSLIKRGQNREYEQSYAFSMYCPILEGCTTLYMMRV